MPRWASRTTLEVTDVRVQRVQEISVQDVKAEGVWWQDILWPNHNARSKFIPRFRKLWDRINAKRGFPWDANPWVWALTFRRIDDG